MRMRYEDYYTFAVTWNVPFRTVLFVEKQEVSASFALDLIRDIINEGAKPDKFGFRNTNNAGKPVHDEHSARQRYAATIMTASAVRVGRELSAKTTSLTNDYFLLNKMGTLKQHNKCLIAASPEETELIQKLGADFTIDFCEKKICGLHHLFKIYRYDPGHTEIMKDAVFNGANITAFIGDNETLNMDMDEEKEFCNWYFLLKKKGIPFTKLQEADEYICRFKTKRYGQLWRAPLPVAMECNLGEGDVISRLSVLHME